MNDPITWGDYIAFKVVPALVLLALLVVVAGVVGVVRVRELRRKRREQWGGEL